MEVVFAVYSILYLSCVGSSQYEYIFDVKQKTFRNPNVSVLAGSSVTLVCRNRLDYDIVTWYKANQTEYTVYIDNGRDDCSFYNEDYPSISLGRHKCKGGNYSVTFSSIQKRDQDWWFCQIGDKNNAGRQSQPVYITVLNDFVSSSAPTTRNSTDKVSVQTAFSWSSSVSSAAATTRISTDKVAIKSTATSDLLPVIGGSAGAIVGLLVIVIMVMVIIRLQKRSNEGVSTSSGASSQTPAHGTSSTEGEVTAQGSSNYSVPHAESQGYQHPYSVIAKGVNRPESPPEGSDYLHPVQQEDVHLYNTVDDEYYITLL